MELIQSYVVVMVTGICLCVGYVLKHFVPAPAIHRWIPLIVAVTGIFINIWAAGWQLTPTILLEGMVSGLAATGVYEGVHQMKK